MSEIYAALDDATAMFRKGDAVLEHPPENGVAVTEVYAMPHEQEAESDLEMFDFVFVNIGVDPAKAELHRDTLMKWIEDYPEPERLAGGPSYIELGGVLGSQDYAFRLMALGTALGVWKLVTPATLRITDPVEAKQLAGKGFIMISGVSK